MSQKWCGLLAGLLLALVATTPAAAQRFGQWWWDGEAGYAERQQENLLDTERINRYFERDLRLALGLNGYLGHPALGSFRLGLEYLAFDLDGDWRQNSRQVGYSLRLDALPRGSYPFSISVRRGSYDYSQPRGTEAFSLLSYPDVATTWTGRLRLRQGPLTGLLLGADLSTFEFVDAALDPELRQVAFADWARDFGPFRNHFRVDRQFNDYSQVDYTTELWTASFDQFARLAEVWNWQLSLSGIRSDISFNNGPASALDDFRLLHRLSREVRGGRDLVDFRLEGSLVRPGLSPEIRGYGGTLYYRWRPSLGTQLAPFLAYADVTGDGNTYRSSRAGLEASRSVTGKSFDSVIAARASYGKVDRGVESARPDEGQAAYSASLTLGHGEATRLRQELELEAGRNELRLARPEALSPLEPTAQFVGIGDEDFARARLRLDRRGANAGLGGWVEWSLRQTTLLPDESELDRETLSYTVDLNYRRLSLAANAGESRVASSARPDLSFRFFGGSLSWRIWRAIEARASYRADRREFLSQPSLDASRAEAGLVFHYGLLDLRADVFESTEQIADGSERRNRGMRWSITRRFAGWLPFATGGQRRGEIQ